MKTNLPTKINTIDQAKHLLDELVKNGDSYHPEDRAIFIIGPGFNATTQEREQLDNLMTDIYILPGNFDPCSYIMSIDPTYTEAISQDEPDPQELPNWNTLTI